MVKEVKNMDELLPEVLEYCLEKNRRLDIAKIQETFQIGYPRASRIVDQMIKWVRQESWMIFQKS